MFRNRIDRWFADFRTTGDPRTLAHVFDRAAPELWRVAAFLCRDTHVAEDAVQSTFLAAIEAKNDWDSSRPLLPWLLGLLANRVREERRRSTRKPVTDRIAHPTEERDPAEQASFEELDHAMQAAMRGLNEPYRTTLEQHLIHGMPAHEIASRDQVAAGTVRMRLHRGLEQLRQRLPKGLVASGVAALTLSPASMAAMRSEVLDGATALGNATPAGSTAANAIGTVSANTRRALMVAATLAIATPVIWLAAGGWPNQAQVVQPGGASVAAQQTNPDPEAGNAAKGNQPTVVRQAAAHPLAQLRVVVLTRGGLEPVANVKLVAASTTEQASASQPSGQPIEVAVPTNREATKPTAQSEGTTDANGVATFSLPAGPTRVEILEPSREVDTITLTPATTTKHVMLVSPGRVATSTLR